MYKNLRVFISATYSIHQIQLKSNNRVRIKIFLNSLYLYFKEEGGLKNKNAYIRNFYSADLSFG